MPKEFYEEMWETISARKESFVGDMQNRKKNGELYWQEVHIIPILTADETPKYFIGIELMLDEQKKCEALIQNCKTPKECYEALSICWPFEWLFEVGHLSEEQLNNLNKEYGQSQKLDHLANQLFAISNVTFSAMETPEKFALLEMLQELLRDIESKFPQQKFMLSTDSKPVVVKQNRKLLRTALESVIQNAAAYSHPGVGEIVVLLQRSGNNCVVKIDDNGIGISTMEQPRIYNKFYRGLRAKKMNQGGAGLGLYLTKLIADTMSWKVDFMSLVDKGTSFTVHFPMEQKAQIT